MAESQAVFNVAQYRYKSEVLPLEPTCSVMK